MDSIVDGKAKFEQFLRDTSGGHTAEFEWVAEYYDEVSENDYGIDFRMKIPQTESNPAATLHGYFHLKWIDDRWKIDDWIVTGSSESSEEWEPVSFSVLLEAALEEARSQVPQEEKQSIGQTFDAFMEFAQKNRSAIIGSLIFFSFLMRRLGR